MTLLERIEARRRSPVFGYTLAVTAFAVALIMRLWLDDVLPPGFPFLTFFPAVILTTFFGGLWPGILSAVLSGAAAWFFFTPPFATFGLLPQTLLTMGFFGLIVVIDIAVIHIMNVALERLKVEQARTADLARHRAVLFQELQHRISNNLQIVSGLLALQRSTVEDEKARQALSEAATRLALIGKIHRKLHDPEGAQGAIGEFLDELCRDVVDASGAHHVVCATASDPVEISPDKIIPLALVTTELVSNAIEHGFAGRTSGRIEVAVRQPDPRSIVLTVHDDGLGVTEGFDPQATISLGLRIVGSLARQIGGRFEMLPERGTLCRLTFAA